MKMKKIFIMCLLLSSCNIPELKELNVESKKEINIIIKELKLEKLDYGIFSKSIDGKQKNYFKLRLYNIDDSVDFIPYNNRLIDAFDNSGYKLQQYDFVVFYYYKNYLSGDLYKYYIVNSKDRKIIEEGND